MQKNVVDLFFLDPRPMYFELPHRSEPNGKVASLCKSFSIWANQNAGTKDNPSASDFWLCKLSSHAN